MRVYRIGKQRKLRFTAKAMWARPTEIAGAHSEMSETALLAIESFQIADPINK